MGDPGSSSLNAIPRSSTLAAQTEILWLVDFSKVAGPGELLLSSSAVAPRSAICRYAGDNCECSYTGVEPYLLRGTQSRLVLRPAGTCSSPTHGLRWRACTTVALAVRYGLDSRELPCCIIVHSCTSWPVSQGSMPSSDERSSDGLQGWLVDLLPVLRWPGQCPVTCGGNCLGQVAVQLLSSTIRLRSPREHGPQGRLARVGKPGSLL